MQICIKVAIFVNVNLVHCFLGLAYLGSILMCQGFWLNPPSSADLPECMSHSPNMLYAVRICPSLGPSNQSISPCTCRLTCMRLDFYLCDVDWLLQWNLLLWPPVFRDQPLIQRPLGLGPDVEQTWSLKSGFTVYAYTPLFTSGTGECTCA